MALRESAGEGSRPPGGAEIGGLAAEILERIQDGFYAIDRDWRFIYANRRACEMWGVARETVVGRVLWERFPQIAGTRAGERLREAVAAGAACEFETLSPVVGRWLWLRVDPIRPGITGVYWRDITDRKRAEEALRASEERLKLAQEGAGIGVWDWNIATDEIHWSPQMFRLLGLDPERDAADPYAAWLRALHPDDRERAHADAQRHRADPHPSALEFRVVHPDGTVRWIFARGMAVTTENGRPVRVVGINIDITERKRLEQELRESEARHRLFAEAALDGIIVHDFMTIIDVSARLAEMFGYAPEELIGKGATVLAQLIAPEDLAAVSARAEAGYSGLAEMTCVRRDGSRFPVEYATREMKAEGRRIRIGILRDITERKRVEAELRRLTEELEARVEARTRELAEVNDRLRRERMLSDLIIESAVEGIIVVDTDLRHVVWNAAMESINGHPRGEMLGRTVFEAFPHLVDHPVGQAWRDALAGRRTEMRDRRYFSPPRGVEITYDADFTPLYDQDRAIIGAICIVRETTERRRMEELLRQSQKMEAVAQLTGGVAHDFNNLLTAVVGCLDMISLEAKNERLASLAKTALRSANRGARLTQQLLSFARRQSLRPVAANLNTLLGEMEVLLRRAAGDAIETVIDATPDLWRCEVDPAQFEAAVMNLVMNARDAMPKGGMLTLETRNVGSACIPEGVELPAGDYVAFAVRDTGYGMTPEVMAKAFEPFFTTKEIGKGSGLGLSMVYGFAKQSGGSVRLESAPGAGTTITLYLPRAADQPQSGSG